MFIKNLSFVPVLIHTQTVALLTAHRKRRRYLRAIRASGAGLHKQCLTETYRNICGFAAM